MALQFTSPKFYTPKTGLSYLMNVFNRQRLKGGEGGGGGVQIVLNIVGMVDGVGCAENNNVAQHMLCYFTALLR